MTTTNLKRHIGLLGAAFVALNCVVGAGVFAMPQALVEGAGAASPYLILVFGALMIFVGLVFAELAGHFDQAGGMVVYANAAFGAFAGFQAGWFYYVTRIAAMGANTNALLTYAATFAPGIDQGAPRFALIAAIWIAFTCINILGVRGAIRGLNVITVAKLAPLLALVVWGLVAFANAIPAPQAPAKPGAVGEITLLLLYAFTGFELATLTAGETRNAKSALPRALVGTIIVTAALYFLVQLAYVAIMQGRAPEGAPLAAAAQTLAGPWGALAIAGAAILSIGGNLFAASIATPRLTWAMAEERSLPGWFGGVHAHFATPVNSILALGLIVGAVAASGAFVWLAVVSTLARMVVYLLCTAALLKVRTQSRNEKRAPGHLLLRWAAPALAGGLCLFAMTQAKPDAWAFLAGFAVAGTGLYGLSRWRGLAKAS
jgi:amino acid transporter